MNRKMVKFYKILAILRISTPSPLRMIKSLNIFTKIISILKALSSMKLWAYSKDTCLFFWLTSQGYTSMWPYIQSRSDFRTWTVVWENLAVWGRTNVGFIEKTCSVWTHCWEPPVHLFDTSIFQKYIPKITWELWFMMKLYASVSTRRWWKSDLNDLSHNHLH